MNSNVNDWSTVLTDVNSVLEEMFGPTPVQTGGKTTKRDLLMTSSFCYKEAAYETSVEGQKIFIPLPGAKKDDIKIRVTDGKELTLTCTNSRFIPSFKVSHNVSQLNWEKLTSTLENGVLTITIPSVPKKVPLQKDFEVQ